jgi:flagellar hook-associated protein 2
MIPNIVHTLGGGSGIDTFDLVNQLVELQSLPDTTRLDKKEELYNTQISDYGLLRSAMSDLEAAVAALGSEDTFNAKSISVPDTSLISLTKLESSAAAGTYKIQIEQVAQAQTLSSGTYTSLDSAVGTGTLTLRFGSWDAGLTTFTVDADKAGAEIVIDDSNNSLGSLRDAINKADIGVQASIVSDGGGYKLLITGPSGASNEIELVALEDGGNPGLASFEFSEGSQNLNQAQEGLDAQIRLNGLLVSRDSNTIDDLIQGLKFDIFNSSLTESINLTITDDKNFAETAIRDFVEAYNTFLKNVELLVGFNAEIEDFGSLRNDSMADNLIDSVRGFLGTTVKGLSDGFTVLANIGIRTKLDGTLEIVESANQTNTNFRAAIDNNFDLVRGFFVPQYESSDTKFQINAYGPRTQAGSYEVIITQEATQATLTGAVISFPVDTTGKDYSFDIIIDGKSATINLPDATVYNSVGELATELQSLINLSQDIQDNNSAVTVSNNGGALEFVSNRYGSASTVAIALVGADAGELGLSIATGTNGLNVAGTVDGVVAFGFGNVLLPAIGSPAEGLKLIIKPGASASPATINFSRGFGGGLSNLIKSFSANNGLISEREKTIKTKLDDVEDDRLIVERRTEAYRARLESQFLAMELIVRSLNNTGTFLDGIADRLPFTAPK